MNATGIYFNMNSLTTSQNKALLTTAKQGDDALGSNRPSVHLSVRPSVHPSIRPSFSLSVRLFVCSHISHISAEQYQSLAV